MSTAEQLIAEGQKQGHTQGLRDFLETLLVEKFGKPSREILARLHEATAEDLRTWGRRVLNAKRLEDVFSLPRRPGPARSKRKK